jgi:hypothetical protein
LSDDLTGYIHESLGLTQPTESFLL